ncbi:unnamed protein product [Rotaria sordida]|uniref:Uncharacterized protein n=1 Tax=Rotaria sordida TaxID=392033 RepID=A0A813WB43_9BILA|nr:unnamed protein product [Rotaria sordida]CAF0897697.1 unnamed protein product [Rotaria sordida]
MMLKKLDNSSKLKLVTNFPLSKPSSVTSSVYFGNANAQRSLKNQGSFQPFRPQSKNKGERPVIKVSKNPYSLVQSHPWKPEYRQLFTREKIKKTMTKDSYITRKQTIAHAKESITTQEECCPVLIPANVVHIETPNIQEPTKFLVPSIIRYLRSNELLPSEQFISQSTTEKFVESQLEFETPTTLSTIHINTTTGNASNLVTNDRLLNRAKMRIDASVIRRPPRRLLINVTHETLVPLSIYG